MWERMLHIILKVTGRKTLEIFQNQFFEDSTGDSIIPLNLYADTHHFHSLEQLLIYT